MQSFLSYLSHSYTPLSYSYTYSYLLSYTSLSHYYTPLSHPHSLLGFYVDGKHKGNESRFINHSCDPNCELQPWVVKGKVRIGIFAIKDIAENEPLSYDYQFDTNEVIPPSYHPLNISPLISYPWMLYPPITLIIIPSFL